MGLDSCQRKYQPLDRPGSTHRRTSVKTPIVNGLRAFLAPEVRVPKKNAGEQHLASHSAYDDSHSYNIQATTNGAKMTATMVISLIRMFKLGPEVSLKGSPTVSPMTAAL